MLLPSALGFSPHPPVSVYGTGAVKAIAAFLDGVDSGTSLLEVRSPVTVHHQETDLPVSLDFPLGPGFPFPGFPILPCPHSSVILQYRNLNLLSIDYVSRPRLRPRLTRADQLYSGTLGYSAERILTFLSLLIPAFSLPDPPRLFSVPLRRVGNAPLPIQMNSAASVSCFSPVHFRRRTSRPVSYYALF